MNLTQGREAPLCKGSWIAVGKTEGMSGNYHKSKTL